MAGLFPGLILRKSVLYSLIWPSKPQVSGLNKGVNPSAREFFFSEMVSIWIRSWIWFVPPFFQVIPSYIQRIPLFRITSGRSSTSLATWPLPESLTFSRSQPTISGSKRGAILEMSRHLEPLLIAHRMVSADVLCLLLWLSFLLSVQLTFSICVRLSDRWMNIKLHLRVISDRVQLLRSYRAV